MKLQRLLWFILLMGLLVVTGPALAEVSPVSAQSFQPQGQSWLAEDETAERLRGPEGQGAQTVPSCDYLEDVGQLGGASYAVAVQGDYAYVGVGPRFAIVNVSDPTHPQRVSYSARLPQVVRHITVSGDFLYVGDGSNRLSIFDVSAPATPEAMGSLDVPEAIVGVVSVGRYLYVASVNLHIFDVSNPDSPRKVGVHPTGQIHDLAVEGGLLYVATANNLVIMSLNNPSELEVVGTIEASLYKIAVAEGVVYGTSYHLMGTSVRVFDATTTASLHEVGSYIVYYSALSDIAASGPYAYLTLPGSSSSDEGQYAGGRLIVLDASDPTAPRNEGFYSLSSAQGVAVVDEQAFVADAADGLHIIDVATPNAPTLVGGLTDQGMVKEVVVEGNYAFVAGTYGMGARILDITNLSAPETIALYDPEGYSIDVLAAAGDHLYVAGYKHSDFSYELRILDASDNTILEEVGTYPLGQPAEDILVQDGYAYIANGASGLRILDVTEPSAPVEAGVYDPPGSVIEVEVVGDYAYVSEERVISYYGQPDIPGGLRILDVSNPREPEVISFYETGWGLDGIAVVGDYVYLIRDRLYILDMSHPAEPVEVGRYPIWGWSIAVSDDFAYIGSGKDLHVVNVKNPSEPVEVGLYETAGNAFGLDVVGAYAFIADDWAGLLILDVANLNPITGVGAHGTPGAVASIATQGNYAYATASSGLHVFDISDPTDPEELGVASEGAGDSVTVAGDYAYVTTPNHMRIFDVSTPSAPRYVSQVYVAAPSSRVAVVGDYAYVTYHFSRREVDSGLLIFDVSDPVRPREVAHVGSETGAWDVAVVDDLAYVADWSEGLRVLDVSDPHHPVPIGSYDGISFSSPIYLAVKEEHAYLSGGPGSIYLLDVSKPSAPVQVATHGRGLFTTGLRASGDYLYHIAWPGSLYMINVADPTAPYEVAQYHDPATIADVTVADDYLYLSNVEEGLSILRFSGEGNPVYCDLYLPSVHSR